VDLIHFHGCDFVQYLPRDGPPALATLHLPLHRYGPRIGAPPRAHTHLNGVSASQVATAPPHLPLAGWVANGVDVDALRPIPERRDHVVALGRICPEKGFHLALDAAHRADVPMLLAGAVHPYERHRDYYHSEIAPRLDARRRFVSCVGTAQKRDLLGRARCLLVSSQIDETSSLVAMEALACGTPVVSFRIGALPEIVEEGRTGLLVNDLREMSDAIRRVDSIDRGECRQAALERFDARRMAADYFALYRSILRATPDARGEHIA
jgi:glycosyltransferase involved in cell wall biosynthesis